MASEIDQRFILISSACSNFFLNCRCDIPEQKRDIPIGQLQRQTLVPDRHNERVADKVLVIVVGDNSLSVCMSVCLYVCLSLSINLPTH